jgi:two-component system OmpR family sensor kinase
VDRDALRLEVTHLKAAGSKFLASDNAAHHGSAALDISAHQDGRFVHVTIRDDGEGISDKNRERIFEPFFTTRREIGGTGMGLVIVPSMLQAHGGSIALVPSEGGAAFEIRVPG